MRKRIFIICNSPQCLSTISTAELEDFVDLSTEDIFTCNFAYTFFRTSGKHYNFISDDAPIRAFIEFDLFRNTKYFEKVKFIFSKWNGVKGDETRKFIYPMLSFSQYVQHTTSGINALLHCLNFDYEDIYLIGYTMPFDAGRELMGPWMAPFFNKYTMKSLSQTNYLFLKK